MTYVPSCEAGPRDREGRCPRVLAKHVPVTRSRGSTPAITATHMVAVPPPCLAPPEPCLAWPHQSRGTERCHFARTGEGTGHGEWACRSLCGRRNDTAADGADGRRRPAAWRRTAALGSGGGGRPVLGEPRPHVPRSPSSSRSISLCTGGQVVGLAPTRGGESSAQRHIRQPQVL